MIQTQVAGGRVPPSRMGTFLNKRALNIRR